MSDRDSGSVKTGWVAGAVTDGIVLPERSWWQVGGNPSVIYRMSPKPHVP